MNLWETYRPTEWADLLGQDRAKQIIAMLRPRGLGGRAYWIKGKPGIGKTTTAYLLAGEIADPYYIQEYDAGDLTPAKLKELERELQQYGGLFGGKRGRAVLVNEAHGLRRDAVRQLLVLLERLPEYVVFIFTTTLEGQETFEGLDDASPLLSRCIEIKLTDQGLAEPFARRAQEIARIENLDGRPLTAYLNLVKQCRNNMRSVLSKIECGEMKK